MGTREHVIPGACEFVCPQQGVLLQITQFMGAHVAKERIILASEFMPRGDLWNALNNDSKRQFRWYDRCAPG